MTEADQASLQHTAAAMLELQSEALEQVAGGDGGDALGDTHRTGQGQVGGGT